jgi:hypothetical protein
MKIAGLVRQWPRNPKRKQCVGGSCGYGGQVMSASEGMWAGNDVDRLINRIELRLEQYRLHAQLLEARSEDRQGADALVRRLEERLTGLRKWREDGQR